MKPIVIMFVLSVIIPGGCGTLQITEVQNLKRQDPDSLRLKPDVEANELRIDIIRHTYEEKINDSTRETRTYSYHPLGFDLGNGIFYDLNGNMSIRLDYLFPISSGKNFIIEKIDQPKRNKGITRYTYHNDSLSINYPHRKKSYFIYFRQKRNDSLFFTVRYQPDFSVSQTDTSTIYNIRKHPWNAIFRVGQDKYYLDKKRRHQNYEKSGNEVFLERDYVVHRNDDSKSIEIRTHFFKKDYTLFTIIKGENAIYIFDRYYKGMKLEIQDNAILVYENNYLMTKYKLVMNNS